MHNPISILLVDDRPENLISLEAVLACPEYRLVRAESGKAALRCLLEEDFALILLDVQMPIMDGFETAELIKRRERSRNIPIIFVTAINKDEPFVYRGYSAGAVDYISKPFDPRILRSKVAVFAELYRANRELARQSELLRKTEKLERERELARIERESMLRERLAHEKYRDLVEGINHGVVWVADAKTGVFDFVSPRAESVLGFPAEDWRSERHFLLNHAHPDDRERVVQALSEGIAKRMDLSLEHRFVKKSGEIVWLQTGIRVAHREGESSFELRGISIDVTHIKRAEKSAHEALQMRDEFLSIASHELKTPLTPLRLQLQTLKRLSEREVPHDVLLKKVAQVVATSDRQVDRLTKLVDELLDISRIHHGKLMLNCEEINLSELIREVVHRFSEHLARIGCTISVEGDGDLVGYWDRLKIEQALVNLLTNAAKYGAGKPIEIHLSGDGREARLSVKDHGIGVSKDDAQRIFNRFERAVPAANFGGLGLGLYIVREILSAHGGKIEVESEPNCGAKFTMRLPLGGPAEQVAKTGVSQETQAS